MNKQVKIDKRKVLKGIYLICPCCKKERSAENTPLLDQELKGNQSYYYIGTTAEQKAQFIKMVPLLSKRYTLFSSPEENMRFYMYQWACNACINKGRAILADVQRQHVMGMGSPIISYMPLEFKCKRCKKNFIFKASEQKFWYEDLRLSIDIHPVNCASCRKTVRHEKYLNARLSEIHLIKPLLPEHLKELSEIYFEMGNEEKGELFERRYKNAVKRGNIA